jgi:hypothetical protein
MTNKANKEKRSQAKNQLFTFKRVSLGFIGALCFGWLIVWLLRIIQNIGLPQIEYSESYMIYIAHLFGTGQWSWNIQQQDGGVMVSFYTPVFYWLLGQLMNILGYSLVVGRVLVLLSFVGCCGMIYLIVRQLVKEKICALIGAVLPLTQPYLNAWSLFVRVDMMALFFELVGVYLAIRFWKTGWFYLTIPLFALAFYTKQSALTGVVALIIFILIKNWRFAITYSVMIFIAMGVPFLIINWQTEGQFFNEIILFQRTAEMFRPWANVVSYLTIGYIELFPILIIGLWYSISNIKSYIGIFAILALAVNLFIIMRPGGAPNYFFEVVLAFSIMTAIALPEIVERKNKLLVYSFVLIFWSLTFNYTLTLYPPPIYAQNVQKAMSIIEDDTYPILTENAGIVLDAGKVPYGEPFVFNQLSHFGYWDENNLLQDMKSGHMEYVISQYRMPNQPATGRFDGAVVQAILDNYHVVLDASNDSTGYGFVVYKNNQGAR